MTARKDLAKLQGEAEGTTVSGEKVEFLGETFRIADKVGIVPLLKFAHYADADVDTGDMGAMAAMYEMLRDTVHTEDWPRFERHAIDSKAGADDLLEVVRKCVQLVTARPTPPPSGSSSGPSAASGNSTGS
jgi:hypothetical protein